MNEIEESAALSEPSTAGLKSPENPPKHLWIVGTLAVLWNLGGIIDYVATRLEVEAYMGQLTSEQVEYFYALPGWMIVAWTVAVWTALGGSVGLLLRKRWVVPVFGLSLVGLAVSSLYNFVLANGAEIMGQAGVVFTVVIWSVDILLLWYSWNLSKSGVLS